MLTRVITTGGRFGPKFETTVEVEIGPQVVRLRVRLRRQFQAEGLGGAE